MKQQSTDRKQIKEHCEELYVHQQKEFNYLASVYKVPERTIRRWATDGDWVNSRKQVNESSWKTMLALKSTLPVLIERLADDPSASNADSLQKVVSTLKKLQKDVDIVGNALMVFREFSLYIKENDPERAETLLDHVEPFIKYLQEKQVK
jgi:hypothetical protein